MITATADAPAWLRRSDQAVHCPPRRSGRRTTNESTTAEGRPALSTSAGGHREARDCLTQRQSEAGGDLHEHSDLIIVRRLGVGGWGSSGSGPLSSPEEHSGGGGHRQRPPRC
jgi:hypothetical protein